MIFTDNMQALVVAICGGIVAALFKLSTERKRTGSDYDWVDFVLLSVTASFVGFIGFLLASWKFGDPFIILAMTALASTGGYPMLLSIKEDAYEMVKRRMTMPVSEALRAPVRPHPYDRADSAPMPEIDAYGPVQPQNWEDQR